jgi:hypothetical protein
MARSLRVEETGEGFIAYCEGRFGAFSFRIGHRELAIQEVGGNHVFTTWGAHARYMLQLVWLDLSDEYAALPPSEDLDVLIAHLGWEAQHHRSAGTLAVDLDSVVSSTSPTGNVFLAWHGQAPDRRPGAERPEDFLPASRAAGFASMRHQGELMLYGVQGLDGMWSADGLRRKAMRIAGSTFVDGQGVPGD